MNSEYIASKPDYPFLVLRDQLDFLGSFAKLKTRERIFSKLCPKLNTFLVLRFPWIVIFQISMQFAR